jgi:hypothetical protein
MYGAVIEWRDGDEPSQAPELRRRKPHPPAILHDARHLMDLGDEGFVEYLDALSRCPQHGVAVLAHVLERSDPQRLELGLLK